MNDQNEFSHAIVTYSPKVIILICLALAFAVMNGTMFNVAIPDIASSFALTTTQVSWIITSFTTVFAVGTLIYGKLADIFSIRILYVFGVSCLAAGGCIGFFASSFEMLIIGRIVQAMGASAVPSLSFIIPMRYFPSHRGKILGYLSATIAFSSGMGPIVGGLIGGILNWRFIFLISFASVFSIPFFLKWLPKEQKKEGHIDYIGAILVAIFVTSILFMVTTVSMISFLVGVITFILLSIKIRRTENSFIDPKMFQNRQYTHTLLTSFFGTLVIFGLIFTIPFMLRDIYQATTIEIGLILFPGAIVSGILGQSIGRMISKKGGRFITKIGLGVSMIGTLLISTLIGANVWLITISLLIGYIGFPLLQSATADLISENLTNEESGVGIGLFNLSNFFAGALSSAFLAKFLERKTVLDMNPLAVSSTIYSDVYFVLFFVGLSAFLLFTLPLNNLIKRY